MELTFALENGMRAAVHPSEEAWSNVVERRCIEESLTEHDVAVIFHVPNRQALDRVMERFGPPEC